MTSRHFFSALLIAAICCANSVWAATFTGTFQKITSVDDLTTSYYVIAASENAALPNYAMTSSPRNSGHINGTSITVTGTTITDPDSTIVYLITQTGDNTYTFRTMAYTATAYYVYQTNTTSGGGTILTEGSAMATITCTGYRTDSPVGFLFQLNGDRNNVLEFFANKQWFSNYSGSELDYTYTPVRLFKLQCSHLDAPTLDGDVVVGETSVTINWIAVTNASGYEVKIYRSGEDTPIATQTVNTTTYTNSSLTANTDYTFSVMAVGNGINYCDSDNTLLEGNFKTDAGSATSLDQADHTASATKIIRDGRLIILRGNTAFTAQGQKVDL